MNQTEAQQPTPEVTPEPATTVIFYKPYATRDAPYADVLAVFPCEPSNVRTPAYCLSYQHVGQHGDADPLHLADRYPNARADEYAPLKAELESLGYVLDVRSEYTPEMDAARRAAWQKMMKGQ